MGISLSRDAPNFGSQFLFDISFGQNGAVRARLFKSTQKYLHDVKLRKSFKVQTISRNSMWAEAELTTTRYTKRVNDESTVTL